MRVAVLGAGLQGACVSMELAATGVEVDLYDKNDRCVTQTSANNEGKIHLGYVYANDPTLTTARLMVRGALNFAPLMRRWIGADLDKVARSAPFYCAIHKQSLLSVEQVEQHLLATSAIARAEANGAGDYFGEDPRQAPTRVKDYDALFDPKSILAAFKTPEIGIDAEALAYHIRARLESEPKIRCITRANVSDVAVSDKQVTVEFEIAGERFREAYDHVVNALWDGRLEIDAKAGIQPPRPWLFRIRYFLRMRASRIPATLPTFTVVLGPFGDIVAYTSGEIFMSWYPAGMRGVSSELHPPDWPRVLDEPTAREIRQSTLAGLTEIAPAVADLSADSIQSCQVKSGVVFAWGSTDIDDPKSRLHERFEIGLRSYGRYHSIDTGKFTMAPLFAKMTANHIRAA